MEATKTNCEHACRNTCVTLEKAIEKEYKLLEMFSNSVNDCNMPDVHSLLNGVIESKKKTVQELQQKLDEIRIRSTIDDDIEESYENADR
jgi:hypothetical protein